MENNDMSRNHDVDMYYIKELYRDEYDGFHCPRCGNFIHWDDINDEDTIVYCIHCENSFDYSDEYLL